MQTQNGLPKGCEKMKPKVSGCWADLENDYGTGRIPGKPIRFAAEKATGYLQSNALPIMGLTLSLFGLAVAL
ncbi:unnamed protein product [marine sediment metagenome]|uniref:Uncharacterized protein n=1 Tax=marine sediment metagenome TaxID=412755 RepID=X1HBC6_9ZZZZ